MTDTWPYAEAKAAGQKVPLPEGRKEGMPGMGSFESRDIKELRAAEHQKRKKERRKATKKR